MPERRIYERIRVHAVVGIDTQSRKDRVGVTRNVSEGGLLFHSASRFEVGEELNLIFRMSPAESDRRVIGRVVRADRDDMAESPFRFLTAVAFEEPVPYAA